MEPEVIACSVHPTYRAIHGQPRSMCPGCWNLWDATESVWRRREAEENEVSTMQYYPLEDAELRELAWGIATDRVFTDRHCRGDEVTMVFPVLEFMKLCDRKWMAANPPGLMWQFMSAASPVGVNGLPMFFSVRFLSVGDTQKMEGYLKQAQAAQADYMAPADEQIPGTGPCGDMFGFLES